MQNLLRWLLRRGSPLPIPNREVKPDCADGTAFTWESMSLPFFMEPYSFIWIGFFVLGGVETHPYQFLEPTVLYCFSQMLEVQKQLILVQQQERMAQQQER